MNDLGEPAGMTAAQGAVSPAKGMPETKVDIRHLDFYYGDHRALKDINLGLPDRQITAFIGPSGCGKSTLLRTLNRMYALYPGQRAVGEVLLDGVNILDASVDVADLRFRVGMVFQKATPFPMSVFENVAFGLRLSQRMRRAADVGTPRDLGKKENKDNRGNSAKKQNHQRRQAK